MSAQQPEKDGPRRPIRVTPHSGRVTPTPSSESAPAASDAATTRLMNVFHELNNLLDGATRTIALARRSFGDLALAPGADPHIAERLDAAHTALEQMGELLHDAMRPCLRQASPRRRETPLVEAIVHAVDVHRPLADEHKIELCAEVSPRLVLTPAGPIYTVLANAVRNAIEAIADSGLGSRVEIVAELTTDQACPCVRIDIVDDGPGPDEHAKSHAFSPGFTTKMKGFGVGLSLSQEIVESLEGVITLTPRSPDNPVRPGGRGGHVVISYPLPQ